MLIAILILRAGFSTVDMVKYALHSDSDMNHPYYTVRSLFDKVFLDGSLFWLYQLLKLKKIDMYVNMHENTDE